MQYIRLFKSALLGIIMVACATVGEKPDPHSGVAPQALFEKGHKAMQKGAYKEAIEAYESFEGQYPLSQYNEQILAEYIYAQYKMGEHELAVAAAERFLRLYPRSSYADYVMYMQGMANIEHSRHGLDKYLPINIAQRDGTYLEEAYDIFQLLIKKYPHSRYVADARVRMVAIRNTLASKELSIAKFYLKREYYVAASNRALNVLRRYPQAPQVEKALGVYIKAQTTLGLLDARRDGLRILKLNFPESKFLQLVK